MISELTMASQKHKDTIKKFVGLILGIFECLLTQNPTNQDSRLF